MNNSDEELLRMLNDQCHAAHSLMSLFKDSHMLWTQCNEDPAFWIRFSGILDIQDIAQIAADRLDETRHRQPVTYGSE